MWRALGLTSISNDQLSNLAEFDPAMLRGLYIPQQKTVYLRESETGVVRQVRLVHELTHALDDQKNN